MQDCRLNILGSEWQVVCGTENDYPALKNCDGYTDSSLRLIVIGAMEYAAGEDDSKGDLEGYKKQVLRHELFHAFLYESGLEGSSSSAENWAQNEEMVDWLAIQSPKIFKAFQELDLV